MQVTEHFIDSPELYEERALFLLFLYDEAEEPYHMYLHVPLSRCRELARQCRDGEMIEPTQFGWILVSGKGHEPDEEVVRQLEELYGAAHLPELFFTPEIIDQANQERWSAMQEEAAEAADHSDTDD